MKKIKNCLALSVFALAGIASAAPIDTARIVLDSPVQIGRQTLPAGSYTIERVMTSGGHQYISFRSQKKSVLATVGAFPERTMEEPLSGVTLVTEEQAQRISKITLGGNIYRLH